MRDIRNCNLCVVGGAGFLGSHLVNHLVEDRNCIVTVVDNLDSGRREFVHPEALFHHHDITGSESYLRRLFAKREIQFVFNYAAHPYIPDSFERPLHVFDCNAFGAMKVINAATEVGCEAILQVSSAEIYGEYYGDETSDKANSANEGKMGEDAPVIPHSSYGAAKAAIDAMIQVRWREAKIPVIALRQFNCVGERETHPYVVPEIISQIYSPAGKSNSGHKEWTWGNVVLRLGNNSFRDFLYAGDAVRMACELLEKGEFGQVYNLGSETGVRIYDLAQILSDIIGCGKVVIEEDQARKRPWEIWHLQSNNSKIYRVIEQRPKFTLREALEITVEYYEDSGRKWCWQ